MAETCVIILLHVIESGETSEILFDYMVLSQLHT